jgi:WD40 repeat protein/serine/threonine protein kinase
LMPTKRQCAECGTPLPDDVPEGACPVCALRGALELPDVSSQAAVTEKPGDRIGRYKLLEKIGEGGYCTVYMAEQTEPIRRQVALKVVKLGMDTKQVIARFEAERQALALMDHPHIAKVLDAGATDTGRPYFVMELVRGIRITDYCDQHNLSTRERLELFRQVCHVVQHAHQKGIIHRDLKPSNVLVTELDGAPVPKVIDFGIAKATQQPLTDKTLFTGFQQFMGTPAYMSPEQAGMSGADIDTRSDIYALGVLLYELVTGHVPFEKEELLQAGLDEMLRLIREKEPLKPSTRLSALSAADLTTVAKHQRTEPPKLLHLVRGDLDWIVMKCLEKDRTRRYETANGLALDLERHLLDEPVVARPPSVAYRFRKMARRNKLAFAAGTAVATAVLVGLAVSTFLFIQERRAHDRALAAEHQQSQLRKEAEAESKKAKSEAERAEAAATEVKMTLSAADFLKAIDLITQDNWSDALPYLVRSLTLNPTNKAAVTRLTTLLGSRSWWVPMKMFKHKGGVSTAEFSPDGEMILITSWDNNGVWDGASWQPLIEIGVWDAASGQPLIEPWKQALHAAGVRLAQFSPHDGKRIVTGSWDKTARVWDVQTGQPLTEPMKHATNLVSAQFSPDGKRIVTLSEDRNVWVWDAQSGQPLTDPMQQDGHVQSVQISPDGKQILTVCGNPMKSYFTARLWDVVSGQPLTGPLLQYGTNVSSAQFSPDGMWILTASGFTVRVWDAKTGQPLTEPLSHGGWVTSAQFSPDGKRFVTASMNNIAQVWDTVRGQPLTQPMKHKYEVTSALFSPDGKRIVTTSADGTVWVWDAQTGQPLSAPLKHSGLVWTARFSPDGKQIVTTSQTNAAKLWSAVGGQPLTKPLRHHAKVYSAQFSPNGKRIFTASADGTVWVWDAQERPAADQGVDTRQGGEFSAIQSRWEADRHGIRRSFGAGVGCADRPAADRAAKTPKQGDFSTIQPRWETDSHISRFSAIWSRGADLHGFG